MMLIGIPPLLSPDALHALRSMGHGDEVALVDANYPAQEHARRLVRADGHGILAVLEAILAVLPLDKAVPDALFRAALNNDPAQLSDIHHNIDATCARLVPSFPIHPLGGDHLYPRIKSAYCIFATGERALFANVILRKGVILPDGQN